MIKMKLKDILNGGIARDIYEAHIKAVTNEDAAAVNELGNGDEKYLSRSLAAPDRQLTLPDEPKKRWKDKW